MDFSFKQVVDVFSLSNRLVVSTSTMYFDQINPTKVGFCVNLDFLNLIPEQKPQVLHNLLECLDEKFEEKSQSREREELSIYNYKRFESSNRDTTDVPYPMALMSDKKLAVRLALFSSYERNSK